MNAARILWACASLVLTLLGFLHLYLTFFTDKLFPANANLISAMKQTTPKLTDKLSIWSGWQGFNASHSTGLIFFGLINFYLAFRYFQLLQSDGMFFAINLIFILCYMYLAGKFWFNVPLIGLAISLMLLISSYVLIGMRR